MRNRRGRIIPLALAIVMCMSTLTYGAANGTESGPTDLKDVEQSQVQGQGELDKIETKNQEVKLEGSPIEITRIEEPSKAIGPEDTSVDQANQGDTVKVDVEASNPAETLAESTPAEGIVEVKYDQIKTGVTISDPGIYSQPAIGYKITDLPQGYTLNIYSEVTANGIKWYKTTYGGQWAYVSQAGVKVIDDKVVETKFDPYKTGSTTKWTVVKNDPTSKGTTVTNFEPGRAMTIYALVEVNGESYYKTTYGGQWAYVIKDNVFVEDPAAEVKYDQVKTGITISDPGIYRRPHIGAKITDLSPGYKLNIYGEVTSGGIKWYKTTYGGQWAYVSQEGVRIVDDKVVETKYDPYKKGSTNRWTGVKNSPTSSGTVVTNFEPGRVMTIYSLVEVNGEAYYKTTYGGQWAYVKTLDVTVEELGTEIKYSPNKIGITDSWTVVKGFPSRSADVITNFEPGRQITVYSEVENQSGKWYKTTYGGQWAYVPVSTVSAYEDKVIETKYDPAKPGVITTGAPVRENPNLNSPVIVNLEPGRTVTLYGEAEYVGTKWYKITYGGKWAYIPKANGRIYYDTPQETVYNPTKGGILKGDSVAKAGPETTSATVGTMAKGQSITVYSYVDYKGQDYYKTTYGGQWAYIPADSVYMGTSKVYQNPSGYRQLSSGDVPWRTSDYNLTVGMSGMKVYTIQKYLGVYNGVARYTSGTASAVSNFQSRAGLPVTGDVDYNTWRAMGYSWNDWAYMDSYVSPNLTNVTSTRADHIEAMVNTAEKYMGTQYVWCASAAPGLGIDCTGLVFQALYGTGIDPTPLGSYSYAYASHQYSSRLLWEDSSYLHVGFQYRQRGDIIVYCDSNGVVFHVAIYVGNDRILEAMTPGGVAYNSVYAYRIMGVIRPVI